MVHGSAIEATLGSGEAHPYVAGTINYECKYVWGTRDEKDLLGFSDSDHVGDVDELKSTIGVVFFLGPNMITWASQKQKVMSLSSCEAEYIAAAAATCQGVVEPIDCVVIRRT